MMVRLLLCSVMTICLSVFAPAAHAQQVPVNQGQIKLSFAPVVKRVAPAVVNIYIRRNVRQQRVSPLMNDPFFRRFFSVRPGRPRLRQQRSLGSGVIVSADGFIVTNHHVVKRADEIQVVLADGRDFQARIVLKDDKTDLAVLKISVDGPLPFLKFQNSDKLEVGDLVLAIGNPFGVGQTVTSGIISALARSHVGISDFQFFIQTDAAINPGNSGGALVDVNGALVGINTAIFSRSGGSNGIGFAIPANMVRLVVASARSGRTGVRRPWLGARLQQVTPGISDALGLKLARGALVKSVYSKGPAGRSGLKRGDVITSIDGVKISHPQGLNYRLATKPIGQEITLGLSRNGRVVTVKMKLELPPEDPPRNTRVLRGRQPFQGARVANLSPALSEELKLDMLSRGVVILDARRGIARRLRFKPGDIIISVEGQAIHRVDQLVRILRSGRRPEWRFTVQRGGRLITATVAG